MAAINLTGLKPSTTYSVVVRAKNPTTNSDWSNVYQFTTPSATVFTINTVNTTLLGGNGAIYAGSTLYTGNNNATITGPGVLFNANGIYGWKNGAASSFSLNSMTGDAVFSGCVVSSIVNSGSVYGGYIQTTGSSGKITIQNSISGADLIDLSVSFPSRSFDSGYVQGWVSNSGLTSTPFLRLVTPASAGYVSAQIWLKGVGNGKYSADTEGIGTNSRIEFNNVGYESWYFSPWTDGSTAKLNYSGFMTTGINGYVIMRDNNGSTFISSGSNTNLFLRSNANSTSNQIIIQGDGTNYSTARNLSPETSNTYNFGTLNQYWKNVYAAAYPAVSDIREKTDIKPLSETDLGLKFINSLNPVQYKFIVGGNEVVKPNVPIGEDPNLYQDEIISIPGVRTHTGLIAQDVKRVIDELGVNWSGWFLEDINNPDSTQAIDYTKLVSPIIQSIKELSGKIDLLESKIAQLENK